MKKISIALALVLAAIVSVPTTQAASTWSKYKIMLDPGHGGKDPGASGPSAPHEATLALRCGLELKSQIEASPLSGTVKMTRSTDVFVELADRRSMSVSYDPYIFCSIHLNAANKTAVGTETWYYWTTGNSKVLANKVQADLVAQLGRANRGVKQGSLAVLRGSSSVPAILTEGLFVDNPTEWAMLNDNSKAGFKSWVRGHLYGFYDHLHGNNGYDIVNPKSSTGTTPTTPTMTVSTTGLHFSVVKGGSASLTFTVSGSNLSGAIAVSSSNSAVTVSPTSLAKTGGTVTVTFNAAGYAVGDFNLGNVITVKQATDNLSKKVSVTGNVSGVLLNKLKEVWNYSEATGKTTAGGYDATKIRNFCYNAGKLYCVYDHSEIKVINAQTGADLGNLNKGTVVAGGTLTLCDVKCIDGVIIACNLAAEGQELRLYAWENDQQEAQLIKTITNLRGATRLGDCMELRGSYNGTMYLTFANDTGSETRIIEFTRTNGTNWNGTYYPVVNSDGTQYKIAATGRAYKYGDGWWLDGKDCFPTWVTLSGSNGVAQYKIDTEETWGSSHHEFRWDGNQYSSNIVFNEKDGNANHNYQGARARFIINESGNYQNRTIVADYPANGLGSVSRNTNATADSWVNTDGSTYVELWVQSTTHGLCYYTYGTPPTHTVTPIVPIDPTPTPTITANKTGLNFSAKVGESDEQSIKITGADLKGAISVSITGTDKAMFSVNKSSIAQNAGATTVKVTYTPTAAGDHTAQLTLKSTGATTLNVPLSATGIADIEFSDMITADKVDNNWTYCQAMGNQNTPGWLELNFSNNYTRDIEFLNNKLYVLNCKAYNTEQPTLHIVDPFSGESKGTVNVSGVNTSARVAIGGLSSIDGKLLASNSAAVGSTTHVFRVYIWDNDASAPRQILEDATHGGVTVGDQLNVSGSLTAGYIWVSTGAKVLRYAITNGTVNSTPTVIDLGSNGEAGTNGSADVIGEADGSFWVVSQNYYPRYFAADGTYIGQLAFNDNNNGRSPHQGTSAVITNFGSRRYMAATTYLCEGSGNENTIHSGALQILDLTDSFGGAAKAAGTTINASTVGVYPSTGLGTTRNTQFQTAVTAGLTNDGMTYNAWGLIPGEGITYATYNGASVSTGVGNVSIANMPLEIATWGGNIVALCEDATVEVYNLAGSLIAKSQDGKIGRDRLASGVYVVRAYTADGRQATRKVVIR